MSDETVAQARRARIEALNEVIRELGGIELDIRSFMDKRMGELERLLDHEKAPDDEEVTPKEHQLIEHQRAKIDELEAELGDREDRIARLTEQVDHLFSEIVSLRQVIDQQGDDERWKEKAHFYQQAATSKEKTIANQQEEIVRLRNTIDKLDVWSGQMMELIEARP